MLKLQSKEIRREPIDIPESVEELTLGQFIELRKISPEDHISVLSIVGNVPLEDIYGIRFTKNFVSRLSILLQPLNESIDRYMSEGNSVERFKVPAYVKIMDKAIKVPEDIFKYAYWSTRKGAMMVAEAVQSDGLIDMTDRYPELIAHYLYCPYTEMKYDEKRANEFIEIINMLPLTVAIPLGNFIVLDLRSFWQTSYLRYLSKWMRTSKKLTLAVLNLFRNRIY